MPDTVESLAAKAEAHATRPIPLRYVELLRDLASGLNLKQIGRKHGISTRAATLLAARTRQRLGVNTNAQAVYEAAHLGLLKGVPRP
jgi:DNA-binding NarL/FixJ family response regulator